MFVLFCLQRRRHLPEDKVRAQERDDDCRPGGSHMFYSKSRLLNMYSL